MTLEQWSATGRDIDDDQIELHYRAAPAARHGLTEANARIIGGDAHAWQSVIPLLPFPAARANTTATVAPAPARSAKVRCRRNYRRRASTDLVAREAMDRRGRREG